MNELITQEIRSFVKTYNHKRMVQTTWGEPLVGFANAQDALFPQLKIVVSPSHAMPEDLLEHAQTVLVYFLPFHEEIARKNRGNYYAAKEWAIAYIETNQLIIDINTHVSEQLKKKGVHSAVLPPTHNFDTKRLLSDWSHKHIAYIAGLGKFGLHHLLITEKGCCGRLGSLILDASLKTTTSSDKEYCLYSYNQTCEACVKRCPNGALHVETFDRHACYELLLENAERYKAEGFADVCGKCTSVVPCSFHNPVKSSHQWPV